MTGSVSLRPAKHEDLPAIMAIENAVFSQAWWPETFEEMLDRTDTYLLVATAGPDLVGYLVLTIGAGEAELANLAVDPARRRTGVAEALLRESLDILHRHSVRWVYLAVRASNTGATRLYEHFGFREIGRHGSYYQEPPEDARILALEVPPPR